MEIYVIKCNYYVNALWLMEIPYYIQMNEWKNEKKKKLFIMIKIDILKNERMKKWKEKKIIYYNKFYIFNYKVFIISIYYVSNGNSYIKIMCLFCKCFMVNGNLRHYNTMCVYHVINANSSNHHKIHYTFMVNGKLLQWWSNTITSPSMPPTTNPPSTFPKTAVTEYIGF